MADTGAQAQCGAFTCVYCGYVYDQATGDPEHGIPAGVRWEDLPDDWSCPMCGGEKHDFEKT